jgi:hypothetical protein
MRGWLRSSPVALWWLVVLNLSLVTMFKALDGVLGAMHLPGAPSYRIENVSGFTPTSWKLSSSNPDTVMRVWSGFDDSVHNAADHLASWGWVVFWGLVVDSAFVLVYVTTMYVLVSRVAARLAGSESPLSAYLYTRRRRVIGLAVAGGFADLVENALTGLLLGQGIGWNHAASVWCVLVAASIVKYAAAGGVVVYLIVATVAVVDPTGTDRAIADRTARGLRLLRGQVVLVVALVLALTLSDQSADLVRRWPDHWTEFLFGLVGFVGYAVVSVVAADVLLHRFDRPPAAVDDGVAALLLFAAGAVVAVVAVAGHAKGLWVPAGLLVVAALAELRIPAAIEPEPPNVVRAQGEEAQALGFAEYSVRAQVPVIVGTAPLVVFALSLLRTVIPDLVWAKHYAYWSVLLAAAVLEGAAFAGWQLRDRRTRWFRRVLWPAAALVAGVVVAVWVSVITVAETIGSVGVVTTMLIILTLLTVLITSVSERFRPLRLFRVLGFRRTPLFGIILVWWILAGLLDTTGSHHNVRTMSDAAGEPITPTQAFNTWVTQAPAIKAAPASAPGKAPRRKVIPMVLIATEGGGIRAAYWTLLVADCLFDAQSAQNTPTEPACNRSADSPRSHYLMAASGVSGGSLGLAEFAAHQIHATGDGWIDDQLGEDFVAPTLAWGLFVDLPDAFADANWGDDRAAVLEQAWERVVPDRALTTGLLALQRSHYKGGGVKTHSHVPLLLLNGTSVQDGCRFETSALDLGGATGTCTSLAPGDSGSALPTTRGLTSFLCPGADVRLSTAALLSARFPYVSPSARVTGCSSSVRPAYVVDGGYFDGSGASTIDELWAALGPLVANRNTNEAKQPCIVPLFIQIDNHYASITAPSIKPPNQALVPPSTLMAVHSTRDDEARQTAAALFNRPVGPSLTGWAHIYPQAHPGGEPPLGWALSAQSMSDMRNQMFHQPNNQRALAHVAAWFKPGALTCPASG